MSTNNEETRKKLSFNHIKEKILELIQKSEYSLEKFEDIQTKLQNQYKIEDEQFYDAIVEISNEFKSKEEPEESKPSKIKSIINISDDKLDDSIPFEDKVNTELNAFIDSKSTILNIKEYSDYIFHDTFNILKKLITPDHYYEFKQDKTGKQVTKPTSFLANDLISVRGDIEYNVTREEIVYPDSSIKIIATCNIKDLKRNITLNGISAVNYEKKIRTDKISGKTKTDYDIYATEKAITRCVRNAIFKLFPKKLIDLLIEVGKEQIKSATSNIRKISSSSVQSKKHSKKSTKKVKKTKNF